MDNIQDQIWALQRSICRQRIGIFALWGTMAGFVLSGAVSPRGDANFDTISCRAIASDTITCSTIFSSKVTSPSLAGDVIKCKSWQVLDDAGRVRIEAGTRRKDEVAVYWMDATGHTRIAAGTEADGRAYTGWFDVSGAQRLAAGISKDGSGETAWADRSGKVRIRMGTTHDGVVLYPLPLSE